MKLEKTLRRIGWGGGALLFVAGVVVLLWPTRSEPAPRTVKKTAYPIALSPQATTELHAPSATAPELGQVRALEAKKDDTALAKIALSPSNPDDHEKTRLRVTALHALAKVGTPSALNVLHDVLEDGSREVVYRMAAATALARAGGEGEIAYLRERLSAEPSKLVREKIRLVLDARHS